MKSSLDADLFYRKISSEKELAIDKFICTEEMLQTRLIEGMEKQQYSQEKLAHGKIENFEEDINKNRQMVKKRDN